MNDVNLQKQMMSVSTCFPHAFKTVNYCLIYHAFNKEVCYNDYYTKIYLNL